MCYDPVSVAHPNISFFLKVPVPGKISNLNLTTFVFSDTLRGISLFNAGRGGKDWGEGGNRNQVQSDGGEG